VTIPSSFLICWTVHYQPDHYYYYYYYYYYYHHHDYYYYYYLPDSIRLKPRRL